MNEFERLIAFLKVQYHNMTTLHRHLTRDAGWFENHEQLGEWYEAIGDQIDDLAETGISLGYREPGIKDVVLLFPEELLDSVPREREDTFRRAQGIMRGIAGMMQAAEAIVPASVQNKLQEYEYNWNKEANYKVSMMLGDRAAGGRVEDDDDD